jgi:hypothetical protein
LALQAWDARNHPHLGGDWNCVQFGPIRWHVEAQQQLPGWQIVIYKLGQTPAEDIIKATVFFWQALSQKR